MNIKVTEELIKTRKAVKQKYLAFKSDIAETQAQLKKKFKPISDPLQNLLQKVESVELGLPIRDELPIKSYFTPKKCVIWIKMTMINIYHLPDIVF